MPPTVSRTGERYAPMFRSLIIGILVAGLYIAVMLIIGAKLLLSLQINRAVFNRF